MITRKILLSLVLAAGFTSTAHAQLNFHSGSFMGLKAGGTAATFTGDKAKSERFVYGANAGIFANLVLNRPFSLQSELLYSMKGGKAPANISDASRWLNYLDVPVALRATTRNGFFLEAGAQVGFLLSAQSNATGEKLNVKNEYRSTDLGYLLGLGYQPRKGGLGIGGRYNIGLLSVFKAPLDGTDAADLRNNALQIYLTYSRHEPRRTKARK